MIRCVTTVQNLPAPDQDRFLVVDSTTGEPLKGAYISVDGKNITSDQDGMFTTNTSVKKITISYVGYATRAIETSDTMISRTIQLQPITDVLDPVSITAGSDDRCYALVGGISFSRKITKYQKAVSAFKQWIPDSTVRVFPNPITSGELLNVQLALKTPGEYAIKVFAADGKQVHAEPIQITSAKQMIQLSHSYSAGTYWLQVQDNSGKQKGHEVKFIVR